MKDFKIENLQEQNLNKRRLEILNFYQIFKKNFDEWIECSLKQNNKS